MGKDFTVTINHPRGRLEWLEMFGTTSIHVKSIIPEFTMLPGFDEPQPVYYVDVSLLTPQQRQHLIRHLSTRFNLPLEHVKRQLQQQDVPIPAADCTLMIQNPHKWLG